MYYSCMTSIVISVRIPKEVKEYLERNNVKISKIVKKFLISYYKMLKKKELRNKIINEIRKSLEKEEERKFLNLIRDDRDTR